jgi:type III secretion apparatus needle protein
MAQPVTQSYLSDMTATGNYLSTVEAGWEDQVKSAMDALATDNSPQALIKLQAATQAWSLTMDTCSNVMKKLGDILQNCTSNMR